MVGGAHRQSHVGDSVVDFVLGTLPGLVREHLSPVALIRGKPLVAVAGDKPAQTLTPVEEAELSPQIHQPIAGWCAGQPNPPLHVGPGFHQRRKPLGAVVLEAGEFVDDDHVKRPRIPVVAHEPGHVLPVNHRHHRRLGECVEPVYFGTNCHGYGQTFQMVPLRGFGWPGVARDPQRGDHQDAGDGEIVQEEFPDGSECDDRFAHAKTKKYSGLGVIDDELGGGLLVGVWMELHDPTPPRPKNLLSLAWVCCMSR